MDIKFNQPWERIPQHANDPGYGEVPPESNVIPLLDIPQDVEKDAGLMIAFSASMDIIKLQSEQLRLYEKENNMLKEAVLDTTKFLKSRGYKLQAPSFKKLKEAAKSMSNVELCTN